MRWVIKTLTDRCHHQRVDDLLDALESEVGALTLEYATGIIGAQIESQRYAYSDDAHADVAVQTVAKLRRSLEFTEWDRRKIIIKVPS